MTPHPAEPTLPWASLVNSIGDLGVFLVSADGLVLSWNAGAEALTGAPASEAIGHPAHVACGCVGLADLETAASLGPAGVEVQLAPPTGARVRAVVSRTPSGYAVRLTPLTKEEMSRVETPGFNRSLLDAMPAHIAVLDAEGQILEVNRAWMQFTRDNVGPGKDSPVSTAPGANYLRVCRQNKADLSAAQAAAGIEAVLRGKLPSYQMEYPCDAPGERRWFVLQATPLGERGGAIVAHHNITHQKQRDEERAHHVEGLRLLAEVTAALLDDLSLEQVGMAVFERVSRYLDSDLFTLFEADAQGLRLVAAAGLDDATRAALSRMQIGQAPCGEIALGGTIFISNVQTSTDPFATSIRGLGVRVYLGQPLRARGALLGTMMFGSRRRDHFPEHEQELLRSLAQVVATAMARARNLAELRAREAKYRAVVETSPDGILLVDEQGRFLDVNDAYLRRSRYTREEFLQRRIQDVEAKEAPDDTRARIERLRLNGHERFESAHRNRAGDTWPVEVTASYWPETGQIIAFVRDITNRKRTEAELKDSEQRLRMLGDNLPNGLVYQYVEAGERSRFTYISRGVEQLAGVTAAEATADPSKLLGVVHLDDWSRLSTTSVQFSPAQEPFFSAEFRISPASGPGRWVYARAAPHPLPDGSTAWDGVVLDVTEQHLAAETLRQSESRLRVALRAAGATAFVWDIQGDVYTRHHGPEPQPGFPASPEAIADIRARVFPQDQAEFDAGLAACLAGGSEYHNLFRKVWPGGAVRWQEEWGIVERDASGAPLRLTGVTIDVTDRRRTERALVGHNRILEKIAIGAAREHIFAEVIALIEEQFPDHLCSILTLERETQRLRFAAGASLPAAYNQAVDGVPVGPNSGSCGTAAHRREAVIVEDIAADPLWEDYRGLALAHGLRSCVSFPILASGNVPGYERGTVLGTFAIYGRKTGLPDPQLQTMLSKAEQLSQQASSGGPITSPQNPLAGATHLTGVAIERELAERALRESEERLRSVLDFSPVSVCIEDLSGRFLFVNRRVAELFGLPQASWVGKKARELFPEAIAGQFERHDLLLTAGASPLLQEETMVLPDGKAMTGIAVRFPLLRADGKPYALCCISTDISERKQAQEERDRLWTESPDLLCVTEADGRLKMINPAWTRRLGWSEGELLGHLIYEFVHPEDREATDLAVGKLARGELVRGFENRYRCRDGSYRSFSWNAVPLPDSPTFYGFARDVTEEKRLAEQFRQAQKMEAIGQLAGGVAHDFNNLLTVINGYTELLLEDASEPQRELLADIHEAGKRASALTAQLLAFSRKALVEPKILDLNEVVTSSVRLLRRLIGEDIQLETLLSPISRVKIDPGHLEQVLMNLAVNARDAMPTGGKLTIATEEVESSHAEVGSSEPPPGRYVMVSVRDTGVGMSDEVKAHIFEPFFTTKSAGKGTGLGLATVYGIVRQAGGLLAVESAPGQGTTFRIQLPGLPDQPTIKQTEDSRAPRGVETVLLAEDEDGVRGLARRALEAQGYRVIEASSGAEAIRIAEASVEPIHLLVTDVVMPDVGGRAVVEFLRRRWPGLPVLYMSGYTSDAIVRHGIETSSDMFVQKPFSALTLARRVREALDASARRGG